MALQWRGSATNVTATLTLRNGVKQEFRERVSEGGAVPRLKDVRESLKAVRSASQDVLNQMVEGERSQQSSNLQKNTTNGEESDYDEEEDNDENSDDDEAMSEESSYLAIDLLYCTLCKKQEEPVETDKTPGPGPGFEPSTSRAPVRRSNHSAKSDTSKMPRRDDFAAEGVLPRREGCWSGKPLRGKTPSAAKSFLRSILLASLTEP
ncbi:hypothetical protein Bbelb_112210 [Branchiostoma belcheri]|nr:hypothetical protein Bbelb_112210 [Branchiostoma belcheri]